MPKIHPTAEIGPEVQLADDVVVGPGCIFEGPITVGPGCSFKAACYLKGPLTLGARNVCYPHAVIGYEPQDRSYPSEKPGAGTVIGEDNVFREFVTIHRATRESPTTIGSGNYFMVSSHVGHDSRIGDGCTIANASLLAGHVTVGDRVTFGGGAGAHQFCRIGRLSMVAGLVAARQDVPPFCIVQPTRRISSLNLVGLRRAGLREHIPALKRAFAIAFRERRANTSVADAIDAELGDDPLCREFAVFFRHTRRGIMGATEGE